MFKDGHLGAALVAFTPVGHTLVAAGSGELAVVGVVLAASLSRLPDVDQRCASLAHRGVTHTLLFAVVVGLAVGAGASVLGESGRVVVRNFGAGVDHGVGSLGVIGFAVGTVTVLSHLAADALTPSGVPLLWPLTGHRFSLGLVPADSALANHGLLVAGAVGSLLWARSLVGL